MTYFIADQATYTLTPADAGSVISVVASYTDGGGNFEQVHSALACRSCSRAISIPLISMSTGPLTFAENQPIGTIVGEFNATDPDANASLTYHLVSGAGDGNNSLFTLDTNGTLRTATTFDYETNASTYTIRVQVRDEYNATAEGNFTVPFLMPMILQLEPSPSAERPWSGRRSRHPIPSPIPMAWVQSLTNGTVTANPSSTGVPSRTEWMEWTA